MRPFRVSDGCQRLTALYPPPPDLMTAARTADYFEQQGLIRLWLSEGIPYAFRELPMLYEAVRGWLGDRLQVHPKCLTIIGSGRIGYSLSPHPSFGRPFGTHSDLDVVLVSESIFASLSAVFSEWEGDVASGRVKSRNATEEFYWSDSLSHMPMNIRNGFVDEWKIPRLNRYPFIQHIADTTYKLREKLRCTPNAPAVKRASLRAYKDWASFINQLHLNFYSLVRSLRERSTTPHS